MPVHHLEQEDAAKNTLATYVYGDYIDDVLNMVRDDDGAEPLTSQSVYYHSDDLYNVVAITPGPGGVRMPPPWGQGETLGPGYVIERLYYSDFGKPGRVGVPGSPVGNTRMWNGRDWDSEVELYYYRTRYMEPMWGRFTSRDWIGTWGDHAAFGSATVYVASAPHTFEDPFGLRPRDTDFRHYYDAPEQIPTIDDGNGLTFPVTDLDDPEQLRDSLHAHCDRMGACEQAPGCTPEVCKEEANRIVDGYLRGLKDLNDQKPGHARCGETASAVRDGINKQNNHEPFKCFNLGFGYDPVLFGIGNHTYVVLGHKCGGSNPSYSLDPFRWSNDKDNRHPVWRPRPQLPEIIIPDGPDNPLRGNRPWDPSRPLPWGG